jgi:hypothetical protein
VKSGRPSRRHSLDRASGVTLIPFCGNETLLAARQKKIKASTSACLHLLFLSSTSPFPPFLFSSRTTARPPYRTLLIHPLPRQYGRQVCCLDLTSHYPRHFTCPAPYSHPRTEYCIMVLCELSVPLPAPDPSRGENARPPTCTPTSSFHSGLGL